jgi:hypothetical protein
MDDDYRISTIKNDDSVDMNLRELLEIAIENGNVDLKSMRKSLIEEAKAYWENKPLSVISIPSNVIVDGHPYIVLAGEDDEIDFENNTLSLTGDFETSSTQEKFLSLVCEIVAEHREIDIKSKELRSFSKGLFGVLRMNDCFTGDS